MLIVIFCFSSDFVAKFMPFNLVWWAKNISDHIHTTHPTGWAALLLS